MKQLAFYLLLHAYCLATTPFLLPPGEEDPFQLRPFLEEQAPELKKQYEGIQTCKATCDIKGLLNHKDWFDHWKNHDPRYWHKLALHLKSTVKEQLVEFWPNQTYKDLMGSVLFYPQELINDPFLCGGIHNYPSINASLALSASYGNPVSLYELSLAYPHFAQQSRSGGTTSAEEDAVEELEAEDKKKAETIMNHALALFEAAQSFNEVARFYVAEAIWGFLPKASKILTTYPKALLCLVLKEKIDFL